MGKNSQDFDLQAILRLANSPAGQQLLAALKQKDAPAMGQAAERAAAGDMEGAKQTLSALLADPAIRALVEGLGR